MHKICGRFATVDSETIQAELFAVSQRKLLILLQCVFLLRTPRNINRIIGLLAIYGFSQAPLDALARSANTVSV